MKRLWVAIALLLICSALSATEYAIVQNEYNYFTSSLKKAEELVSSFEYKKAVAFIEKTQDEWKNSQKRLNIFLVHEDGENISDAFAQLYEFAQEKDKEQFLSLSNKIKRQLFCLKQNELPKFSNIL